MYGNLKWINWKAYNPLKGFLYNNTTHFMMYSPRYDVHLNTLEFVSSVVSSNIILSLWTQDRIQYGVGFQYLTCKTISYKTYTNLYCNRFEEPKINFVHSLWKRIEKHSYKNFIPLASFSHNFLAYLH